MTLIKRTIRIDYLPKCGRYFAQAHDESNKPLMALGKSQGEAERNIMAKLNAGSAGPWRRSMA